MKTDSLFYELFQAAPQTFFELLQITPQCTYRFESITVKASEKRIDGIFEPKVEGAPIYFLEVQGFPDDVIYWRTMREVATYFEQRPRLRGTPWQVIVLWLNKNDDPGLDTLLTLGKGNTPQVISVDMLQLLRKLKKRSQESLVLSVLHPLMAKNEREVRQNVLQWAEIIHKTPDIDPLTEDRLISVLSQLIEQKFKSLNYKELSQMLRLTPFRETASVQEVLKEDNVETLTALIQAKFSIESEITDAINTELQKLELKTLKSLFTHLLQINTLEQLEQWIVDHQ